MIIIMIVTTIFIIMIIIILTILITIIIIVITTLKVIITVKVIMIVIIVIITIYIQGLRLPIPARKQCPQWHDINPHLTLSTQVSRPTSNSGWVILIAGGAVLTLMW